MEVRTEPMNAQDLGKIRKGIEKSRSVLKKIALYGLGFIVFILFVPLEIAKIFTRSGRRSDVSGQLFDDIGLINTVLFILIPFALVLFWIYSVGVKKVKRDFKEKTKEIGIVKVKSISRLPNDLIKELYGAADHELKFEKNSFKVGDQMFLKSAQPELMHAKAFKVEVSSHAKYELSRQLIHEGLSASADKILSGNS